LVVGESWTSFDSIPGTSAFTMTASFVSDTSMAGAQSPIEGS
jgi:hypothetical protein